MENTSIASDLVLFVVCILVGIVAWYFAEKRRWTLRILLPVLMLEVGGTYYLMNDDSLSRKIHPHICDIADMEIRHVKCEVCADYPDYGYKAWEVKKYISNDLQGEKILLRLGDHTKKATFLMIGDSHALSFVPGMAEIAAKLNLSGYYLPMYVTPFHNRMIAQNPFRFDADNLHALSEWLRKHEAIQQIILIQRWSIRMTHELYDVSMPLHYDGSKVNSQQVYNDTERALSEFCEILKKLGKEVIIMTEVPSVSINPLPYVRRALLCNHAIDMQKLTCLTGDYYRKRQSQINTFSKLEDFGFCKVLPIHRALLKSGFFCAYMKGKVLMEDDDHISTAGAILYAREHYMDWASLLCPIDK